MRLQHDAVADDRRVEDGKLADHAGDGRRGEHGDRQRRANLFDKGIALRPDMIDGRRHVAIGKRARVGTDPHGPGHVIGDLFSRRGHRHELIAWARAVNVRRGNGRHLSAVPSAGRQTLLVAPSHGAAGRDEPGNITLRHPSTPSGSRHRRQRPRATRPLAGRVEDCGTERRVGDSGPPSRFRARRIWFSRLAPKRHQLRRVRVFEVRAWLLGTLFGRGRGRRVTWRLFLACLSGSAIVDHRDTRADRDGLAFRDENRFQHARRRRGNVGIDLVGRQLEQRLVELDAIARLLQPANDRAFRKRFPHLGHDDVD